MSKTDRIKDTMAKVVDALIALVEASDGRWIKPWVDLGLGKQLRITGEPYKGTNQIFLSMIAASQGLEGPHIWAGYAQWVEAGFRVRKGEHSPYKPIFASPVRVCENHGRQGQGGEVCCDLMRRYMMLKVLAPIFHVSQVDTEEGKTQKLPEIPDLDAEPAFTPDEIIEAWKANGMVFKDVDSDSAFYTSTLDYINMPPVVAFRDIDGYRSTVFHEASHWTGHGSRLNRPQGNVFGSPAYAQEELVAEMSAAMLGAQLGFSPEPHPEHAAYLKNWLGAIKSDPTILYDTAVSAEKASNFLVELGARVEVNA